ncbi:hypothetical protein [Microcella sp.]|uniref:hypothetical protein n=1 Tax=Microcella sp. TaxID=1913979 RepID=UPI00391B7038
MTYADTQAVKALIQAIPALATATFVGEAKRPPPNDTQKVLPPYVVLFPADGVDTSESLTGPKVITNPEFTGWIVGDSAEQANVLLDLLKQQIYPGGLGVRVEVDGRDNDRLWFESPTTLQRDTSVTPPLLYHVFRVGWRSQPSTP